MAWTNRKKNKKKIHYRIKQSMNEKKRTKILKEWSNIRKKREKEGLKERKKERKGKRTGLNDDRCKEDMLERSKKQKKRKGYN